MALMAEIQTTISPKPELWAVRPSIYVVPSWEATVLGSSDAFGDITISVVYDEVLGRFAVESVTVKRSGDGTEVTGTMLRDIRIQERVQHSALQQMWIPHTGTLRGARLTVDGQRLYTAATVLKSIAPMVGRATKSDAQNAVYIYDIAEVAYLPPLKTIADTLKVSQSTATRLMARARDLGLTDGDD